MVNDDTTPVGESAAPGDERVLQLLRQLHAGDEAVVEQILAEVMPWLRQYMHHRMRGKLRARLETQDVVQDAVANFLKDAPRFEVQGENQFRAFIRRIADNVIRGHHRYFERQRRRMSRERPLSGSATAAVDTGTPSKIAAQDESEAQVRLALEMLDPIEQRIICMRIYDDRSFREIGEELDLNEEAARQRFRRAMPKLKKKVGCLRDGDLWGFLGG